MFRIWVWIGSSAPVHWSRCKLNTCPVLAMCQHRSALDWSQTVPFGYIYLPLTSKWAPQTLAIIFYFNLNNLFFIHAALIVIDISFEALQIHSN